MNAQNQSRHLLGSILCAVSFLIATGTTAFAQSSGQTRPFSAVTVDGERTDIQTPPDWPVWKTVFVGKATHLGKTSGYTVNSGYAFGGWWTGDTIGFHLVGVAVTTLVAANGDEVEITTNWRYYIPAFLPLDSPYSGVTVLDDWFISGGTGRFENATGSGTLESVDDVSVLEGRINY